MATEGGAGQIGAITLKLRREGQVIELTHSTTSASIEGVRVPTWIFQRQYGVAGPEMSVMVELRDGSPEFTELTFNSPPGHREVQQKDLRAVDVDRFGSV